MYLYVFKACIVVFYSCYRGKGKIGVCYAKFVSIWTLIYIIIC